MGKGTDQVEFAQRFGRRYTTPSAEAKMSDVIETVALVRQMREALMARRSFDVEPECAINRHLFSIMDEAISAADKWLAQKREPLTDEQIREEMNKHKYHRNSFKDGVRFAEQAHGIGLPTEGDSA